MRLDELNWAVGDDAKHAKKGYVPRDSVVVWVRIRDVIDNQHRDFRISPESDENRIGKRFDAAVDHWKNGGWMNPSQLGWNDHWKTVDVGDGRHRLAAALSMGEEWAPVLVDPNEIPKLKKVIGLSETDPNKEK